MRLFTGITMFIIGALLLVASLTEANAFTPRKNSANTEIESMISEAVLEDAPILNRTQTTSRGKIKFHMKTPLVDAQGLARRPRINRVRSTTVRSNAVFRDSIETDVSLEDLKVVSFQPTTARRIWRTSTTPRSIFDDSMENDDVEFRNVPVVNRNPVATNRLNRFRTTTVPAIVVRDSLEQDDDDLFVLAQKPAVPRPEKTNFSVGTRFNRFRTTTARNLVSRDSVETNDVSLEDLIVVSKPAPMVNRALTAPRSRGRIQMKTSLDSISPSTSTLAPTTPADSTEKIDISTEDLEKIALFAPSTTLTVTELETAITEEIGTTTMPTTLVSFQSDEQDDIFVTDRTTVAPEPASDLVDTTVTMVQLTATQPDEQMDFERVEKLAVALDGAQMTDQLSSVAMTTLISQQSDEQDDWTVSIPTSTMAPPVTRSPLVSRGRGRFQSSTPIHQVPRNRINRVGLRLNPIKSSVSIDSDELEVNRMVKETQTTTSRAPASGNRFSRVRTTTVRPPVFRDSVERNDVSLEDLIVVVPTTRSPLMGSRFSRFRTTTTAAPVVGIVEQEPVASRIEIPKTKSRFSRVRTTTTPVPVSMESVENDSFILANDFSKVKASKIAVHTRNSNNGLRVMPTGNPAVNRGRGSRGRTTATTTPISRQSVEDISLEDTLKQLMTGEQMSVQQPAMTPANVNIDAPSSDISRHSDEHDDFVDVPVTSSAAVTLVVGIADTDISDEAPTTTTLDPVSRESGEKDGLELVLVDEAVVPAIPTGIHLQIVDLPDISDEAAHTTTFNPISRESEELPLTKMTKRIRRIRKQNSKI